MTFNNNYNNNNNDNNSNKDNDNKSELFMNTHTAVIVKHIII